MHLLSLLALGLLALMFFVKFDIPWEKVNIFWLMAFVFHVPLLLFLIAAVTVEIRDLVEKKHMGQFDLPITQSANRHITRRLWRQTRNR